MDLKSTNNTGPTDAASRTLYAPYLNSLVQKGLAEWDRNKKVWVPTAAIPDGWSNIVEEACLLANSMARKSLGAVNAAGAVAAGTVGAAVSGVSQAAASTGAAAMNAYDASRTQFLAAATNPTVVSTAKVAAGATSALMEAACDPAGAVLDAVAAVPRGKRKAEHITQACVASGQTDLCIAAPVDGTVILPVHFAAPEGFEKTRRKKYKAGNGSEKKRRLQEQARQDRDRLQRKFSHHYKSAIDSVAEKKQQLEQTDCDRDQVADKLEAALEEVAVLEQKLSTLESISASCVDSLEAAKKASGKILADATSHATGDTCNLAGICDGSLEDIIQGFLGFGNNGCVSMFTPAKGCTCTTLRGYVKFLRKHGFGGNERMKDRIMEADDLPGETYAADRENGVVTEVQRVWAHRLLLLAEQNKYGQPSSEAYKTLSLRNDDVLAIQLAYRLAYWLGFAIDIEPDDDMWDTGKGADWRDAVEMRRERIFRESGAKVIKG